MNRWSSSSSHGAAAAHHTHIGALQPGAANCLIVAVIIARKESKCIKLKDGGEKFVAKMTLRDSPGDFANVTLWHGSAAAAEAIDEEFHIGDVVELTNPRIQHRNFGSNDENFVPYATSPVSLVFSEPASKLARHFGDPTPFTQLLSIPTKSSSAYFTLSDILSSARFNGQFVDVLAAVKSVGAIRSFRAKSIVGADGDPDSNDARCRQVREVRLFDQTSSCVLLKLWDYDWIHIADDWMPRSDIIFLADVKVTHDSYRGCYVLSATGRTVITANPLTDEAQLLAAYAAEADLSDAAAIDAAVGAIDVRSIRRVADVLTINELASTPASSAAAGDAAAQITAVVYAHISKFDLDGPLREMIRRRCIECRALQPQSSVASAHSATGCVNMDCPVYQHPRGARLGVQLDIRVNVTDATGTLTNCKLAAQALSAVTSRRPRDAAAAEDLAELPAAERTRIKWDIFLEPARVHVLALRPTVERRTMSVVVLNAERVSMQEFVHRSLAHAGSGGRELAAAGGSGQRALAHAPRI